MRDSVRLASDEFVSTHRKSEPGPPITLGNPAAARVRLIVCCLDWRHQANPTRPRRQGATAPRRPCRIGESGLVCSQCRIGGSPAPPLARSEVFAELKWEKRCPTSDTARIRSHLSDNSSGLRRVSYPPAPTPPCEDFSLCNLSAAGLRLSAVHAFGIVHRRTYRPPSCSATSSFSTPSIPRGRGTAASGLCTKVSEIFSGFHQTPVGPHDHEDGVGPICEQEHGSKQSTPVDVLK